MSPEAMLSYNCTGTSRQWLTWLRSSSAKTLVAALNGHRLEALIVTTLALGLREGETLGLRWSDIDFEVRSLRIRQQYQAFESGKGFVEPKTERSKRPLPLPEPIIALLKRHHQMQLEERLLAGGKWNELGLVFTSTVGTPIHPSNMLKRFQEVLEEAGLLRITFHDLRRSCSSLLAAWNVPPRLVSDTPGSNITLTLSTYTRSYGDDMRDALDKMATLSPETETA